MSRIRSIHPGIYSDEAWASVSITARWLGMGLCTEADDNGVFEWKPLQLKMRLFPADAVDVAGALSELVAAGIVIAFDTEGRKLGAIRNFCRYQRPRKPKSWFPITAEVRQFVALGAPSAVDPDDDAAPVPKKSELPPVKADPVPPKSEKSPQVEDGGGRKEDRANALVPGKPATTGDATFIEAWKAYPHFKGRGLSKSKTWPIWRDQAKACGSPEKLLAAVRLYARIDKQHRGDCGAPAFDRWLKDGRWDHWLEADAAAPPVSPFPAKQLRDDVVGAKGEAWATSWLDPCGWDAINQMVIPRNEFSAGKIHQEIRPLLDHLGIGLEKRSAA